ncbi:MAG: adenylate/guanylate cyclase domain-containing protein [Betaproteobacteria bacterium]|nr:MAG: adenylate/guanylate cyclase domain-containing protein [Betaproteobacteria bacterium]
MLSAAVFAAALGSVAAYTTDHLESLPHLLAEIALWLGIVNAAGALVILRPVGRFLRGAAVVQPAFERRMRALPRISGLWLSALTAAALLGHAAALNGSWGDFAGAQPRVLVGTLVHIALFAAYVGLIGYFLIFDYVVRLRRRLWEQGVAIAPRQGKFMRRLIAGLLAVATAPVLLPLSDRWVQPADAGMPMAMAMSAGRHVGHMQQTSQMDLYAALLLAAVLIFLMVRGFSRPVAILLTAMRQVDRGDLAAKAPVVSDDEFGLLAQRFNRMIDGLRERDRIRKIFGRFVPESVAATLLVDEGAIAPKEREATVLFTDIENFTLIAASLDPRDILDVLNAYFEEIAQVVHAHGGVITQFQGDAVLASFNLPASDPEHARHAVEAALAIQARLAEAVFGGGIRLRTRVGISTGPVVGGTVGGGDRLGYTVHGDTVNLAARFEAMNKEFGSRVLVSARTAELAGEAIALRDRGIVTVRGFHEPLRVYEPFTREAEAAQRARG